MSERSVFLAEMGEKMKALNEDREKMKALGPNVEVRVEGGSMLPAGKLPWGPPPLSAEAQVTIERAETFNRTRSAVQRARECHKRAVRQAEELTSTALTVLEDAEEHYRDAALALRRVSSS